MQNQQIPELAVFQRLCKSIDSGFSRLALSKLEQLDPSLLEIKPDPRDYLSAHDFSEDYLLASLLSKWYGWKDVFKIDTRRVAIDGWTAAEVKNSSTNKKWASRREGYYNDLPARDIFYIARERISLILGSCELAAILDKCEWTRGSTAETKFGMPLSQKMSKPIAVSTTAVPYLRAHVESDPHWVSCFLGKLPDGPCSLLYAYKVRESSRFLTVPKNAKTDRCISAEPAGNIFLQRGVGIYIRDRLSKYGIRLRDQSVNQEFARRAYSENLATLDLKAASDSISIEVVSALLPVNWFNLLNDLRTRTTRIEGSDVKLQKFSAMGNGFTFELETLIFHALSYAVAKKNGSDLSKLATYGDDIICHAHDSEELITVLNDYGFDVNIEKSFTDGPFYESCGKHYFAGRNVTPVYQKKEVLNLQEEIRLFNRIYRWGYSEGRDGATCTSALRYMRRIFKIDPQHVNNGSTPCIPSNVSGDDGFLVDASWLKKYDINRGYLCSVFIYKQLTKLTRAVDALLAYKLRKPSYQNNHPKGWEHEGADAGIWVHKRKYVHDWPQNLEDEIVPVLVWPSCNTYPR